MDEITVNGLAFRSPVHILLRIKHLTPIGILIPGGGGVTLPFEDLALAWASFHYRFSRRLLFQYQLKSTLKEILCRLQILEINKVVTITYLALLYFFLCVSELYNGG